MIEQQVQTKKKETNIKNILVKEYGQEFEINLLGTAHVSKESIKEVENFIEESNPKYVLIELCNFRKHLLTEKSKNDEKEISFYELFSTTILKEKSILKFCLIYFNLKISKKLNIEPGGEFKMAYEKSKQMKIPCYLIDRPVNITMKRIWNFMSIYSKFKLIFNLISSTFYDISPEDVESLKESDMITMAIKELSVEFPELSKVLINERDIFMSLQILNFLKKLMKNKKNEMESLKKKIEILKEKIKKQEEIIENKQKQDIEEKMEEKMIDCIEGMGTIENEKEKLEKMKNKLELSECKFNILENEKQSIVVVIGKGHQNGIEYYLKNENEIPLKEDPIPINMGSETTLSDEGNTSKSSDLSDFEGNDEEVETKYKRKRAERATKACTECRKSHRKCDFSRPCSRCDRLGLDCVDSPSSLKSKPKQKKKKRTTKKRKREEYEDYCTEIQFEEIQISNDSEEELDISSSESIKRAAIILFSILDK
eukprot:gene6014-10016_t